MICHAKRTEGFVIIKACNIKGSDFNKMGPKDREFVYNFIEQHKSLGHIMFYLQARNLFINQKNKPKNANRIANLLVDIAKMAYPNRKVMKTELTKEQYSNYLSQVFDDYKKKSTTKGRSVNDSHIAELLYTGIDTKPSHVLVSYMRSGKNLLPEKCIKNFCRIFRIKKADYVDVYMAFKRWELNQKLKNM